MSQSHIFSFCVSIIWEEDMLRCIIVQKITFPLGTQLHRSKHKHVLTDFPFVFLSILFI